MTRKVHLLVWDPIAFAGGSKVATENILACLDPNKVRVTLVTRDSASWKSLAARCSPLFEFPPLARSEQGLAYFARHAILVFSLLWARLRHGPIDLALGASGPGIDLALYLARSLLGYDIVQLVHGPVGRSRTIGRCLCAAWAVFYLEGTRATLLQALETLMTPSEAEQEVSSPRYQVMTNGLPSRNWPSPSQTARPVLLWAASLLRWKGLDLLLEALRGMAAAERPETHVCYIRPKEIALPVSEAPQVIEGVAWHENPSELDSIRASASLFVSTSQNEPFGLSVLEAIAAGLCVLIPADGAYWDRVLIDGTHCVKYRPGDTDDLRRKLLALGGDMAQVKRIGDAARQFALDYTAESLYAPIVRRLEAKSSRSLKEQRKGVVGAFIAK